MHKRTNPNYSQISGYIPNDLAIKLRVAASLSNKNVCEILEVLVRDFVEGFYVKS